MIKWIQVSLLALWAGLSMTAAMGGEDIQESSVTRLDHVLSDLSPVSLPDGAWIPYSLCMMQKLGNISDGKEISLSVLTSYIKTFDWHGSDFPEDIAYRLDQAVISPCLPYNPIVAIEEKMHALH